MEARRVDAELRRAAERLNPRKAKTGTYPVMFDKREAGSLIGHVMGAINGIHTSLGEVKDEAE